MVRHVLTAICFVASVLFPTAASSQGTNCIPRDVLAERLNEQYDETRRSIGLNAQGNIVEVYAKDGGTWTIVLTTPNGLSCITAVGDYYQQFEVLLGDPT